MNYKLVVVDIDKSATEEAIKQPEGHAARFFEAVHDISKATNTIPLKVVKESHLNSELPKKPDPDTTCIVVGLAGDAAVEIAIERLSKVYNTVTSPDMILNGHTEPSGFNAPLVTKINSIENTKVFENKQALLDFIQS